MCVATCDEGYCFLNTHCNAPISLSLVCTNISVVSFPPSPIRAIGRAPRIDCSKLREVVAFSKAAGLPLDMAKKVRQHFR